MSGVTVATGVAQTILAGDPGRKGNCLPACVATFLGISLQEVPHFLECGIAWNGEDDRVAWWAMLPTASWLATAVGSPCSTLSTRPSPARSCSWAGLSPRGVMHQVLYRDGQLWHDPHPSGAGVVEIQSVEA